MLHIICHQETTILNNNEMPLRTYENGQNPLTLRTPNADKDVEQQELFIQYWWESNMVQLLWKTVWQFLTKLRIPYDPAIALLDIYSNESKTYVRTQTCSWMFIAVLFIIGQTWKAPRCPSVGG